MSKEGQGIPGQWIASRPVAGVLFDLDNTLWDRDHAFRCWAMAFVEEELPHAAVEERAAAVEQLVILDAHGYGAKPAMFAVSERMLSCTVA